jgi:hypothetical protein
MRSQAIPILRLSLGAATAVLLAAIIGCAQLGPTAAPIATAPIPPIPAGDARIWVYRTYEPYANHWLPAVYANGATIGWAQLGGAFYRDLAPGHYHITAETWGVDLNQSSDLDLAAGQQAYIRIVSAPNWFAIPNSRNAYARPTYYAWSILPQVAVAQIAPLAFNGGS